MTIKLAESLCEPRSECMDLFQMIEPGQLVRVLLREFEQSIPAYPNEHCRLRLWTEAVCRALRVEGEIRNYEVYCADGKPGFGEYLLDVMWWNPAKIRPDIVFESEWAGIEEAAYDFEKLLFVKARMKVIVCDPPNRKEELLPTLAAKLMRYPDHVMDERYIVIQLNGNPSGGSTECHSWRAPASGLAREPIRFTEVSGSPFQYNLNGAEEA